MGQGYLDRIIDRELDDLLPHLPAISLDGAKGVGKTATALRRVQSYVALDGSTDRQLLSSDGDLLARAQKPMLLDEWQRYPPSWDLVRRAVDRDREGGQFLLTGSAPPPDAQTHSGAGRIVRLRMWPLSFAERRPNQSPVSLARLLTGSSDEITGSTEVRLTDYVDEIVVSGFPGMRTLPPRPNRAALDGYVDAIVEHDFTEQGHPVRRPEALRAWMSAYAAATSTTASWESIRDAATPGTTNKPTRQTSANYRDVLGRLRMLGEVDAWIPQTNDLGRLSKAPKHHLVDPALACRLLGITADSLTTPGGSAGVRLGHLFESLVTQSLRVYSQANEARLLHFSTATREVDLIVENGDGSFVAVEVKVSPDVTDHHVRHLKWLRTVTGDRMADAVVITTGRHAYRRADGIAVVPLALLGP
ncbi:ATP-binding protein [Actinomycetes bacterium M1A6_2h]